MHPVFARKWFATYLLVWIVFAIMLSGLLRLPGTLSWRDALIICEPLCLFYAFVCLTPFYMCRQIPLNSSWASSATFSIAGKGSVKLVVNHLAAAILATTIWIEMARLIAYLLGMTSQLGPLLPNLVVVGLLLYSLSVALHYMLQAVQQSREINPHFLVNSLNSITALTTVDPSRAREMCIRLSDFLRNTLGLGEKAAIPWREELQLARNYLEVEQIRFGTRLHVEMNVEEACSDCMVPPLVLQPLIENAVKHGIATLVEGGTIKVEGKVTNGLLEVSVENGFDPDSPAPRRHGLGLRNVRSRLETRFGPLAKLSAHAGENHFRAEMIVPCRKAE